MHNGAVGADDLLLEAEVPEIGNVPSAKDVAENILAWAKKHRMLQKSPVDEAIESDEVDKNFIPQRMFSQAAVQEVFRRRSINLVGYSEPEGKVVIFTHGKLTASDQKLVPFSFKGVEIEYIQGGIAQVKGDAPPPRVTPYTYEGGAVRCGSSIYPVNCRGAGTFGALVRDAAGDLYGLTNNHVGGACNLAAPGLPILCPGSLDANEDAIDPFTIGRHARLLPINDGIPENVDIALNCDTAIFKISDPTRVSSFQGKHRDTPALVVEPVSGMSVEKIGRTTGLTTGKIIAASATPLPVSYKIPEYGITKTVFFNDVYIVVGENGTPFSRAGDSGSLVMGYSASGQRASVGLVFAGDEARGLSFILPLPDLLSRLGVTLVSGHNVP
ncbi:hypothetical protein ACT4MK_22170 [Bradyrhizobium barranii]|uniref:hypothetical protein n=1 Tax=Bradyrhizobium barranii TaxID=2992140 RepID=UPI0040344A33